MSARNDNTRFDRMLAGPCHELSSRHSCTRRWVWPTTKDDDKPWPCSSKRSLHCPSSVLSSLHGPFFSCFFPSPVHSFRSHFNAHILSQIRLPTSPCMVILQLDPEDTGKIYLPDFVIQNVLGGPSVFGESGGDGSGGTANTGPVARLPSESTQRRAQSLVELLAKPSLQEGRDPTSVAEEAFSLLDTDGDGLLRRDELALLFTCVTKNIPLCSCEAGCIGRPLSLSLSLSLFLFLTLTHSLSYTHTHTHTHTHSLSV